jgi:hypothetical protein
LVPEYGDEKDREKSEDTDNSDQSDVLSPRHVERIVYDTPSASDFYFICANSKLNLGDVRSVDQEG